MRRATTLASGRPLIAQRRVRELRLPAARDQLLNHQRLGRHHRACFVVRAQQRLAVVNAPGLGGGQTVEALLPRGLQDDGILEVERLDVRPVARIPGRGRVEAERVGKPVGEALVARVLQHVPGGCREDEVLREPLVVSADQARGLLPRGDQCPRLRAGSRDVLQRVELSLLVCAVRPGKTAGCKPRHRSEAVVALTHHPHRHAVAAEAADDAKSAVVAAKHERTGRKPVQAGRERLRRALGDAHLLNPAAGTIERATEPAANAAPATKRISGPWLQAAGAPTKCRPATELSKP